MALESHKSRGISKYSPGNFRPMAELRGGVISRDVLVASLLWNEVHKGTIVLDK